MKQSHIVVLGILTSAALFATTTSASTGVQSIKASFANIQMVVNNQVVKTSAEPFIYNHNVYVPVSAVGHALQSSVTWQNKPALVTVTSRVQSIPVYLNGQALAPGITDGKTFYDVPATDTSYVQAFGMVPTVALSDGDVNFEVNQPPFFAQTSSPLVNMTPTNTVGDFANPLLYPKGELAGYWPASVLGSLYPGQFTIEWGINPGQKVVLPGVSYALQGKYNTLSLQLAIDDLTKDFAGAVQLTFLGDGKPIGNSAWITTGQQAATVTIPVTGVKTLTIDWSMKDNNGKVYTVGQSYTAPTVNPDGSKLDPYLAVDVMNAYVS